MKWLGYKTVFLILLSLPLLARGQKPLLDSSGQSVMIIGGVGSLALFCGALAADEPARDFSQRNQTPFLDDFTHYANYMGSKKLVLPLNTLLFAGGLLSGDQKFRNTSFNSLKSVIGAAGITVSLKYLTGRSRPYTDAGAYRFDPFPENRHAFRSLPSGHATLAFAFVTPFAQEYSKWLYTIPLAVGFSRIYKDDHWVSDVIMGSAIGFLTGYFFQEKNRHIEVSARGIVIKF